MSNTLTQIENYGVRHADYQNMKIAKVLDFTEDEIYYQTEAGEQLVLPYPYGIDVSPLGSVYITVGTGNLYKYDSEKDYLSESYIGGKLHGISLESLDFSFRALITSACDNKIREVELLLDDGGFNEVTASGTEGQNADQFNFPSDVAYYHDRGHIYVADKYNHRIQVFDAKYDGMMIFLDQFENEELITPTMLQITKKQMLLVTDAGHRAVLVFTLDGKYCHQFGDLDDPRGICQDPAGNILVADRNERNIQVFLENFDHLTTIQVEGAMDNMNDIDITRDGDMLFVTSWKDGKVYILLTK